LWWLPIICLPTNDCVDFLIDGILNRYDEAPADLKPYRQKDGALLAIGTLCDKLKQTDPYKSELERMLVQHVFPEFSSRVGHLRAKVEYSGSLFYLLVFFTADLLTHCELLVTHYSYSLIHIFSGTKLVNCSI